MSKLLAWVGATVGGPIGWWAVSRPGLLTAFTLSTIGTGFGWYLGRRLADRLLE